MKSRIRSRWYRANEKPLVSTENAKNNGEDQMGEISISSMKDLKDDLADSSAKQASQQHKKPRGYGSDRDPSSNRKRDGSQKSNHRRRSTSTERSRGDGKQRSRKHSYYRDKQSSEDSGNKKPDSRPENRSQDRKRKSRTDKRSKQNSSESKSKTSKKGVSGFLSKLFGG